MAIQLNFIGNTSRTTYPCAAFNALMDFLKEQRIIGLDTETNYVESILERKLKVIAIANEEGDQTWVIQWEFLSPGQQKELLESIRKRLCIIHNVSFDYQVLLKYGCILNKVYDTMLGEQVLTTGLASEKGYHGLKAIYWRRFGMDISKDEQLTFGDTDEYTDNQIQYAAIDTIKLGVLRKLQLSEMQYKDLELGFSFHKGLKKTIWWENEFALAVGDMETNGIRIDRDTWYTIEDSIRPTHEEEKRILNELVKRDFADVLYDNDMMFYEDTFIEPIWTSAVKKKEILQEVFGFEVEKTSSTELKKLLQQYDPSFPEDLPLSGKKWMNSSYPTTLNDKFAIIKLLILATGEAKEEMHAHLNAFLLTNMKQFCIDRGWLIPKDTCVLNWASPVQRLRIFQAINPFIDSTSKEALADYIDSHEIIAHYLKWADVDYQLKSFGKKFYDEHVELDGKHRTRYNQVLSTGRLSSVEPNILNIPRKKEVFRKAVIPDPGFVYGNADFDGQEMVIVATLSSEPNWLEALRNNWDLHSRNAELVFENEWKDSAENDCTYYKLDENGNQMYQKCKCFHHQELRDAVKAVGFGLIYGISEFALAARLNISVDAARGLMDKFFALAPEVKAMMDRFGKYGVDRGYIVEPVFGRVRFFDQWKLAVKEEHAGLIRKSYNFPIQAAGSALLKIAIVLLRRFINQNNLRDKIQVIMPYHDEISIQFTPEYEELGKAVLEYNMRKAAKIAGFSLLGASAASGKSWFDAH